nr:MAG TPA: hypothetical protein [Microviridae sp.]
MENNYVLPKSTILVDCLISQREALVSSFKQELSSIDLSSLQTCSDVFNLVSTLTFYSDNLHALNELLSKCPEPKADFSKFIDFDSPEKLCDDDMRILG